MSFNPQTGYSPSNYALKNGSNITTTFSVNGNRISDVKNPEQVADAVNKSYVDVNLGNTWKVDGNSSLSSTGRIGTTVTGDNFKIIRGNQDMIEFTDNVKILPTLDMNNTKIINTAEPTDSKDVATKNYVDNNVGGLTYVWIPSFTNNTMGSGELVNSYVPSGVGSSNPWNAFNETLNSWDLSNYSGGGGGCDVEIFFTRQMTLTPSAVFVAVGVNRASNFSSWSVLVSQDAMNFTQVASSNQALVNNFQKFERTTITSDIPYLFMRFRGLSVTTGNNPGVRYFQCYDKLSFRDYVPVRFPRP